MGYQFVVEDAPDLTIPADTILKARLQDIKLHEFEWTNKQGEREEGAILQWWFEVTDGGVEAGKYVGRKVKGETDVKISNHPRNKFRQWAQVLLDRELPEGMAIDTDDLIGLSCEIAVDHEADKKDPSRTYERVIGVLPISANSFDEVPF